MNAHEDAGKVSNEEGTVALPYTLRGFGFELFVVDQNISFIKFILNNIFGLAINYVHVPYVHRKLKACVVTCTLACQSRAV